jgi:hypothetical protein
MFAGLALSMSQLGAQSAQFQLIHTVVDGAGVSTPHVLDSVDVYVSSNGGATWVPLALNMKFRQATPYTAVPAGVGLTIGIAPGNATSPSPILYTANVPALAANTSNVGFLTGRYLPSPDIQVTLFANARVTSQSPNQFDFTVFHAVSDAGPAAVYLFDALAPTYTISYRASPPSYSSIEGFITLVLGNSGDLSNIYSPGYIVPPPSSIGALGQAGVLFFSGSVSPLAFNFDLALPDGRVIPLAPADVRRFQLIHGAADPSLSQIDFHVGSFPSTDIIRLDFRQATPVFFLAMPTGTSLRFHMAQRGNTTTSLGYVDLTVPPPSVSVAAVLQGVLTPASFAPNPDGAATAARFGLVNDNVLYAQPSELIIVPYHSVTDAPAINLVIQNVTTISNLSYGGQGAITTVPAGADRDVEVRLSANNALVGRFQLSATHAVGGNGAILLATGFANPSANQNGPALGLHVVYPRSQVYPLTSVTGLLAKAVRTAYVSTLPEYQGSWAVSVSAAATTRILYRLTNTLGQVLLEGEWDVPSAGSWIYTVPTMGIAPGAYYLQVGEETFRVLH